MSYSLSPTRDRLTDMFPEALQTIGVSAAVALIAALYASVGHGGASGYLAVMALLSVPAAVMKPGALALNLLVAGIGAVQYFRAGHFRFRLLWPFALSSIPMSYAGARLPISLEIYGLVLAATLVWAGARLAFAAAPAADGAEFLPPMPLSLAVGALIGFVSGMVGVGGGIFLSPLFILKRWGSAKETAAVSAAFIWLNSASGLLGHAHVTVQWPAGWIWWAAAAAAGGVLGSHWGSRKFSNVALRRILAVVLLTAACKSAALALA